MLTLSGNQAAKNIIVSILESRENLRDLVDAGIDTLIPVDLALDEKMALRHHYRTINAISIGQSAAHLVREEATQMYLDRGYERLVLTSPDGTVIRFQDKGDSHDGFRQWLNFVADLKKIPSSTVSTLYSFVENIAEPVIKGLLKKPDTGEAYTLDEVLDMREGHTQKASSALNRLMAREDITEEQKMAQAAEVLALAEDPSISIDEYAELLRSYSLSTRRNALIAVDVATVNGKIAFLIVADEKGRDQVDLALRNRSTLRTRNVEDLLATLMELEVKPEDRDAVKPPELDSWLSDMK